LRSIIRWNALAIILRANKESSELGGHIASFQSAATLYDIGFGTSGTRGRPSTMAATCSISRAIPLPGFYARAFLEGRLTEDQMLNFRQETEGKGLSSTRTRG
jgi:pyruvate dehydrogenase E1 component